jgi:hypothetical protein
LIYGHGGVKILPKQPLMCENKDVIDFTTGFGLSTKVFDEVSNITAFNYDEFSTFRSAYRECAKLSTNLTNKELVNKLDVETITRLRNEAEHRLHTWTTVGKGRRFGEQSLIGAQQGKKYGLQYQDDDVALKMINDYEWMQNEFNKFFRK